MLLLVICILQSWCVVGDTWVRGSVERQRGPGVGKSTGALTLATFHYKVKDAVDFAISPLWLQFLSPGVAVFFKNSSS